MRSALRFMHVLATVVGLLAAQSAAAETAFIAGLNDVPLMPGLTPLGETLVFDKPGGRIAEATFNGRARPDAGARRSP